MMGSITAEQFMPSKVLLCYLVQVKLPTNGMNANKARKCEGILCNAFTGTNHMAVKVVLSHIAININQTVPNQNRAQWWIWKCVVVLHFARSIGGSNDISNSRPCLDMY